ncbi:MAG: MFS transporter [Spirochaetes bacterium]|nr:MFS transporter [Spirochaetota bacterium]
MTILIYMLPFLTDVCIGIFLFAYPVAASKAGATPFFIANIPVVFSFCYLAASFALARVKLSSAGYYRVLIISILAMMAAAVVSYLVKGPLLLVYLYVFVIGSFCALFFVSFQVIMDMVSHRQPLYCNVSNYNISWSLGLGAGPLISGLLYEYDARISFLVAAGLCLTVLILLFVVRSLHLNDAAVAVKKPTPDTPDNKVRFGWALILLGAATGVFVRVLFPDFGLKQGFSTAQAGALIFCFLGTQAVLSFLMRFIYEKLERIYITVIAAGCALASLCVIGFAHSLPALFAAFALFGVFQTVFFFYAVFYALSNRKNASRNVSINEGIVGAAGIIAPFAFGSLATKAGYPSTFAAVAGFVLIVFVTAYILYLRSAKHKI